MRNTHVRIVAPLLVVLGVALGAGAPAALAQTQLQANESAARADAAQHLRGVRVPDDAMSITTEPGFARSFATTTGPEDRYGSQDHAMWTTTASPQTILAYVRAHPPSGSTADIGTGSGSDSKTGVTSVDIQFSWPDQSRRLLNRKLTVTVVTPRHGKSVIVAQTQSSWFVPRSAAESVPARVHAVEIVLRVGPNPTGPVVRPGGHIHTTTYVVYRAAKLRSLIRSFDALPIVQPSMMPLGCPLMLAAQGSGLTLNFKTSAHGATLAQAQVSVHHGGGYYDGGGACDPIDFTIGSKQQTSLMSPTFVKQVGKLIGADIS